MTKPKYICTIGPSTSSKDIIKKMYEHGMSHIRFNMSYRLDYYDEVVNVVHELQNEGCNIGIICDLAGTEMRVNNTEEIKVSKGQTVIVGKNITFDQGDLSLLKQGEEIVIRDGRVILRVDKYEDGLLYTTSLTEDTINVNSNCFNKTIYDNLKFISHKDELNLLDAIRYKVDYIAVSHVRTKSNLDEIREFLRNNNSDIKLLAKVENKEAMDNLDEVIDNSDGVIIARGDLGKILPIYDLAYNQRIITEKTLSKGKYLMSATDYLFSLVDVTTPSRAEIVDLFSAYESGITNIMFTKEVSVSKDPIYLLDMANKVYESFKKYKGEK